MLKLILFPLLFVTLYACSQNTEVKEKAVSTAETKDSLQTAYFAAGCFWCVEAIFERLKGVISVTSGYAGGKIENPTYEDVSKGITGHAEVVRIEFEPKIISYEYLL